MPRLPNRVFMCVGCAFANMSMVVLLTAIGGDISQGVATIIRECRPDYRLVGVDVHSQHGGHKFVDCFSIVPPANSSDYLFKLKSVVVEQAVNLVFPLSDPELVALWPFRQLDTNVEWMTAGSGVVKAGVDKLATAQMLSALGLPGPWTYPVSEGLPKTFPCILKGRFGSGSRGVYVIANNEDAIYYSKQYPDAIFQEMLEPADCEVTCAVYRTRKGDIASLLMLRRLSGGFTSWAKVIRDHEIVLMCEQIATELNLQGSMNIQLRKTQNGPRIFEINPRVSSTALMRHRLGFTDVLWALDEASGKSVSFPKLPENQIMVRVQGALVFADGSL